MITLHIEVPKDVKLTPPPPAALMKKCNRAAGRSLVKAVKDNFKGLGGRYFWGTAARRTTLAKADAESAEINIAQRGVHLQWQGGTVRPTGNTSEVTGKPTKNLLIPVGNSPLKGKKQRLTLRELGLPPASIHIAKSKNGKVYLIAEKEKRVKRRKGVPAHTRQSGILLGRLVPQATIPAHPNVLPDADERRRALAYGAQQALNSIRWFKQKTLN